MSPPGGSPLICAMGVRRRLRRDELFGTEALHTVIRAGRPQAGENTAVGPETRYALSGDVHIAYQVVGDGPFDLVFVPGFVTHMELQWRLPGFAEFLDDLGVVLAIDPVRQAWHRDVGSRHHAPNLETRMDDVRAVMDAVGSRRAAFYGLSEGAAMSILFAATYPERTAALVLRSCSPRTMRAPGLPVGPQ